MLTLISDKAQDWAQNARNSGLRSQDFHISVNKKFWPKIRYRLCANTAPFDDLVASMHKPYYWMVPIGGLKQSAKRELWCSDSDFYGLGSHTRA